MNAYVSPEEEKRQQQFNEDNARYTAQNAIALSLNNFIKSLESQKEHAEKVLNWIQADKWRDLKISTLEDQMNRVDALATKIKDMFSKELKQMSRKLYTHVYDDFDWIPEFDRVKQDYYNLHTRFVDIEKDHKLLMTKILELEQRE